MSNLPKHTAHGKVYIIVNLIFVILALSLGALMASYWSLVLEPRLRQEAEVQAKFLAQSQSGILADALSGEDMIKPEMVIDAMNHILLFSDPVSGSSFFISVTLEIDYSLVSAEFGSLNLNRGQSNCHDCFPADIPIYSKTTDALLGMALFQVSGKFFQMLRNDVRNKLLAESSVGFLLLVVVWYAVVFLIRKLQKQFLERERAERALAQALQEQEAIMASMPDIFYLFDTEGYLVKWNKKMEELTGLSHDTLKGRHVVSFVPPEEKEKIVEAFREVFNRGIHWIVGHMLDAHGNRIPYQFSGVAIKDTTGKIVGLAGMGRDVTEQKRAEREIRDYAVKLEQSNKELHDFAHTASHDLQEPLRKVKAFSNLLCEEYSHTVGEDGNKYLFSIQNAVNRMQNLIKDLLSYSRITTMGEPFVPVSLSDVTREALDDLQVLLKEAGGRVEIGDMPTIEADPTQMRRLMQNLIGNSLKYRRKDVHPLVSVTACVEKPDSYSNSGPVCLINVKDNGIGFDEKYSDKIFAVFQRLHGRNEYEGTGIGLALCSKIAARHGGTISAKSKPGQGSTFTVTLPAKQIREENNER